MYTDHLTFQNSILRQRASALLTALFIMTIVAVAATMLATRLHIQIQRSQWVFHADQNYSYARGVSEWARGLLKANIQRKIGSNENDDERCDQLPLSFKEQYQQALVTGELGDLQARFNINQLANTTSTDASAQRALIHLLTIVEPSLNEQQALLLVSRMREWMQGHPGGNRLIRLYQSVSQLREIKEIPLPLYLKIEPFLIALPSDVDNININTAPFEVISTLGAGLTPREAKQFVGIRNKIGGFKNVTLVTKDPLLSKLNIPAAQMTVQSQYFYTKATVTFGDQTLVLFDILKRTVQDNKTIVDIIYEGRNAW